MTDVMSVPLTFDQVAQATGVSRGILVKMAVGGFLPDAFPASGRAETRKHWRLPFSKLGDVPEAHKMYLESLARKKAESARRSAASRPAQLSRWDALERRVARIERELGMDALEAPTITTGEAAA